MSFDKCFANLKRKLEDEDIASISNRFKSFSTDLERVKFILSLDESMKCISFDYEFFRKPIKDAKKSTEFRAIGNKLFGSGNMIQALSKYTESLCYAPLHPDDSNCLSLSYANRSAVLFRQEKYQEALVDIDLAIENHYPVNLLPKLLDRKGDCFKNMQCPSQAKDCYEHALKMCTSQTHPKLIININEKLLVISHKKTSDLKQSYVNTVPNFQHGTNFSYPSLSSSCEVSFDATKGRHIVASRDIMPGEIILIEKPFASILAPQRYLTHCHHCLACAVNPIPCTSCVYSIFCSDSCRKSARQSFHKYECNIMGVLNASGLDKFSRLAVRSVLSIPASDVCCYSTLVNYMGKTYRWNDYSTICTLITNDMKRSANDLFRRSVAAVYLLKIIEMTSYFQEAEDYLINVNVAALLLKHLQSFPCNAHEISDIFLKSSILNSRPRELGAGIYATLSLFNHSCSPDVTRNFYGDICVVRAISVICKGSEITDNYGVIFQLHSKAERNEYLSPQYYFACECCACLENWPSFKESSNRLPHWKCNKCGDRLKSCQREDSVCEKCQEPQDLFQKQLRIRESEKSFNAAYGLLLSNKPKEALSGICAYLKTLSDEVCKPYNEISKCQESLKQCYSMMANCCISEFED